MNIYEMPEFPINDEVISVLTQNDRIRIERIISTGQQSDWYDQEEGEFVILLEGRAQLVFEGKRMITMEKGDTLQIPPHQKHRVAYTSTDPPCIWLCVFYQVLGNCEMKKIWSSENSVVRARQNS